MTVSCAVLPAAAELRHRSGGSLLKGEVVAQSLPCFKALGKFLKQV